MKIIYATVIVIFMTVFALGGVIFAEEEKVMQAAGEITAVFPAFTKFTMRETGKDGNVTCKVIGSSKITSGGASKAISDVKVGDKVSCTYVEKYQGRTHICKTLDIK